MGRIKHAWQHISNIGIHAEIVLGRAKRIRLLNQAVASFAFFLVLIAFLDLFSADWIGALIEVAAAALSLLPLLLHYHHRYGLARWFFYGMLLTLMSLVSMLYGPAMRSELSFIGIAMLGFVLVQGTQKQILLVAITLLAYIGIQLYWAYFPAPLAEMLNPSTNYLIFSGGLVSMLLIVRVFTWESEATEQKLQLINHNLSQANLELERFAYVASHDLKTPLRNISSFLGLISRRLPNQNDPDLMEYLEYAASNARQMHTLINDILHYSRLDQDLPPPQPIDLNESFQKVLKNLTPTIEQQSAQVKAHPLPVISGIPNQWELLFQNLIENGIKYNEQPVPQIHIRAHQTEGEYVLEVLDNGIGIQPEYRAQIFDMFQRLHAEGQYSGTGIGLAIVKKIVVLHGGTIVARNRKDASHGTCFEIRVPLKPAFPPKTGTIQVAKDA